MWALLGGLIVVCWVLIITLALHRIDRPPGFYMEDFRQFMESFKAKNYDDFGKRVLPLYVIAYPLMVIVAVVMVIIFKP